MKSVDASSYVDKDGSVFNFFAADTDLTFDGTTYLSATVDQYRNGEKINESIPVYMYNTSTSTSPSVGDAYGYPSNIVRVGKFETGDYLCLFSGETASRTANINFKSNFKTMFLFEMDFNDFVFYKG